MDVGCYCVSGSRLIAGEEPDVVFGVALPGPTGVDILFTGLLHFPSGVVAEFAAGFTSTHHTLEAIGSGGALMLSNPWEGQPGSIVRGGGEAPLHGGKASRPRARGARPGGRRGGPPPPRPGGAG